MEMKIAVCISNNTKMSLSTVCAWQFNLVSFDRYDSRKKWVNCKIEFIAFSLRILTSRKHKMKTEFFKDFFEVYS